MNLHAIIYTDATPRPEQAIEKQSPLIDRHVWALCLLIRPLSNLSNDTENDAARNDPKIKFTKCSGVLS